MTREMRAYVALIVVTLITFALEKFGADLTGSHALDADAWHVLGHAAPFAAGLAALVFARRGRNPRIMERFASLFNVFFLAGIAMWAGSKGVVRLVEPVVVVPFSMLLFAIVGTFGNVLQLYYLHRLEHAHTEEHTYGGQLRHIVGDLLTSIAVIAAGVFMLAFGWIVADAVASLFVAAAVGYLAFIQARALCRTATR